MNKRQAKKMSRRSITSNLVLPNWGVNYSKYVETRYARRWYNMLRKRLKDPFIEIIIANGGSRDD